jgi:hypothetical protein
MIVCVSGCAPNHQPASTFAPELASKPCALVAQRRMDDAGFNGHDAKDQRIVFRYVYADCVRWEAKGFEPPIP